MRNNRSGDKQINFGIVILVILLISIVLGFLADLALSAIEKSIYKKPDEYAAYVEKYSKRFGVPEELIWAVIKTESGFDSSAESGRGAVGLMQLMPETFNEISTVRLKEGLDIGMRYDPETNIRYGTFYLSYLYERYGDWDCVIAAYNWGFGNVDKWIADGNKLEDISNSETRNYLKKVNKAWDKYEKIYIEK